MRKAFYSQLEEQLTSLRKEGLYKEERVLTTPQQAEVSIQGRPPLINLCSNNYLGLANHPQLIEAAQTAVAEHGFGLSSVRFICGTQTIHKQLEAALSHFLGFDDTLLYSSCFDANGGLFETLLGEQDAIISDALNHASIIDGIRLCKARRLRYANCNLRELEERLKEASDCRYRMIATDGVFSMDGAIAPLSEICDLADRYDALVMVDDSHAVGFMGKTGRGTHEHCNVLDRIDVMTGTLGKALGGASGGYTSGRKPIIDWLRQRSRPYLFSNTLAPAITATSLKVLDLLQDGASLREKLWANTTYFREQMTRLGFRILPGTHPIVPVMIGDAPKAAEVARQMLAEGVYVVSFSYPVVPQGQARIRTQISAAHQRHHLDLAIHAFERVGRNTGLLPR